MQLLIKRDILFEQLSEPVFASGRLEQLKEFTQHGHCTCYDHSVAVAKTALLFSMVLPMHFKQKQLVRGALLHDYFLYDWHTYRPEKLHGFSHPYAACENARRDFDITPLEENIIKRHMFPLTPVPPKYRESVLVTLADKVCATSETFTGIGEKIRSSKKLARIGRIPHALAHVAALFIAFLPWT